VVVVDPERRELDALARANVDFTGRRVLDVGCGDGRLLWRFADAARSVVGIDTDDEALADARTDMPAPLRDKVELREASIVDLDDPDSSFDLVFFTWSL
jgi:ubiquinone/menaquinone biosynthesis C-methylase UbiE